MVVAALVLASVAVSSYALRVERSEADRRERDVARQAAVATDLLVVRGIAGLRGARGLVDELGFVDPDGFDAFAGALDGAPGLEGVFLVRRVPRNQRELFEVEIGQKIRDLSPSGELVPAASRPVHYAVERVAPPGSSLGKLLGVDLLSEPARAEAIELALTSGGATLTGPIGLAGSRETGFLAIEPLFRRYEPVTTPEQRRRALAGFVAAGYGGDGFLRAIREQLPAGAEVRIADGERVVAGPSSPLPGATTATVAAGGRTWTIETVDPQGVALGPPLGVLAAGIALTALVAVLFAQASRREGALEAAGLRVEQARRRTAALQAVTSALSGAASAEEVIAVVFEEALEPLGTTGAAVWLASADGSYLELARASGRDADGAAQATTVAPRRRPPCDSCRPRA